MESGQKRRFAVVTGASSGIGFELAKVFAAEGFDLLIAAEDDELDTACRELIQMTASVESLRVDLSRPEGVEELYERIQATGRPADAIALNAGIGAGGAFATETDLDKELRLIDLNVRSTVHLCKLVLSDMVERNEGRILFTSLIASTLPGAFQAVYNASKSFVQSFALAIRNELKDTEVTNTKKEPRCSALASSTARSPVARPSSCGFRRRSSARSRCPRAAPTSATCFSPTCCRPPGKGSTTRQSRRAARLPSSASARSGRWPPGSPGTKAPARSSASTTPRAAGDDATQRNRGDKRRRPRGRLGGDPRVDRRPWGRQHDRRGRDGGPRIARSDGVTDRDRPDARRGGGEVDRKGRRRSAFRPASIANSSESSKKGGEKSGKGNGGGKSQKRAAGREGGKKSGKSS